MDDEANVTEAYFERVFNLGNYETFRVGLTATVGPGQTAGEVVSMLDKMTIKIRHRHDKEEEIYGF
jgi:hypothetical protein